MAQKPQRNTSESHSHNLLPALFSSLTQGVVIAILSHGPFGLGHIVVWWGLGSFFFFFCLKKGYDAQWNLHILTTCISFPLHPLRLYVVAAKGGWRLQGMDGV